MSSTLTYSGHEIGVASSKTFTATVAACYLLALGRLRDFLPRVEVTKRLAEALEVPRLMERALAREVADCRSFLFLGRGLHHPMALEGALKLKEPSYIHPEAYAGRRDEARPHRPHRPRRARGRAGPPRRLLDRMLANIEEVKARDGRVIAVCHEGDTEVVRRADRAIFVPPAPELLAPMVSVITLQFLAYHVAVHRGLDVDQPRNLAKSVTVE